MCLTQDGTGLPHRVQAERLARAGARLVQLRMKGAGWDAWVAEARACAEACHRHGALLVVNDSAEVAAAAGADGAHVGASDGGWAEARARLGRDRILGGTVNGPQDARRALESGCLDYAGVGPFRFTSTKAVLAPVQGPEGVRALVALLGELPAWVIGGVLPDDMAAIRASGARGAAVSGGLHRGGLLEGSLGRYLAAWDLAAREPAILS
jgi:thiamine-phosphate diphosphorylase